MQSVRTDTKLVAVLLLDSLRADMVDDSRVLAGLPALRSLFKESALFERAYAPSHWTLPTHASLFTGLPPREHGAHPPSMKLREGVPTIAEIFREEGYSTACVTCNPVISELFGLTRGFNVVWQARSPKTRWLLNRARDFLPRQRQGSRGPMDVLGKVGEGLLALVASSPLLDNGAKEAVAIVRKTLRSLTRPTFLFVNLMEAHGPYQGRGAFASWRRRLQHANELLWYDTFRNGIMGGRIPLSRERREWIERIYWEGARYADRSLGVLVRHLSRELDRGYLIVLSDHGHLLGEKGGIDHPTGLSERLLRVPVLVRPPGGIEGRRQEELLDITWLFSLLERIASGQGDAFESWLEWVRHQGSVVSEARAGFVPYAISLKGYDARSRQDLLSFKARHDHPMLACVSSSWKLVCHLGRKEDELYRVATDPQEEVNLLTKEEHVVNTLHEKLRSAFVRRAGDETEGGVRDWLPLETKLAMSKLVLRDALASDHQPAIMWTGGKDSTLLLYLALGATRGEELEFPPLVFVDHGQHFPETWSFVEETVKREELKWLVVRNDDVFTAASEESGSVPLGRLDAENQEEALKAGLDGQEVSLDLNTAVGNHMLKTVALKRAIQQYKFDTVITGIRWDESPARAREVFFSARDDPPHTRVHPILPWREREVWTYTLNANLPIHPLYSRGYRSLGGAAATRSTGSKPAWEQDLEGSDERSGRAQDKEGIMRRLRDLGYF